MGLNAGTWTVHYYKMGNSSFPLELLQRDAHVQMTRGDDKFMSDGKTATEPLELRHNEPHYGHSNASHRKRSYGYNPKDLPPLEL